MYHKILQISLSSFQNFIAGANS